MEKRSKEVLISKECRPSHSHIDPKLLNEAKRLQALKSKQEFKSFVDGVLEKGTNPLLNSLITVSGCTRDVFLQRLTAQAEFEHVTNKTLDTIIQETISELSNLSKTENDYVFGPTKPTNCRRYDLFRVLCEIASTSEHRPIFVEWCRNNSGSLCEMIVENLSLENPGVSIEACVCIASLARILRYSLFKGIELVIAAMIRIISIAMLPLESHISAFRAAQEVFTDAQILSTKPLTFHFAPLSLNFQECKFKLIGFCYFTTADLIWSIPHPKIIHFFQCRILRRKEITRLHLLQILASVVECLPELRREAAKVTAEYAPEPEKQFLDEHNTLYDQDSWKNLPVTMYAELLRIYNDPNMRNEGLIRGMLPVLKAHSGVNLPISKKEVLKTLGDLSQWQKVHKLGLEKNKEAVHVKVNVVNPKEKNYTQQKPLVIAFGLGYSPLIELDVPKEDAEVKTEMEASTEGDNKKVDGKEKCCDSYDSTEAGSTGQLHRNTLISERIPTPFTTTYTWTNTSSQQ